MTFKKKCGDCCYDYVEDYLAYTTKKELRVKNRFIGAINLIGMLSIITYVVVYTIIIDKGYQLKGLPTGYVSTKTKGVAFNTTSNYDEWSFFESVDLVQPAIENDGLFLTTAIVQTWQSRGVCDGEDECETDDDCPVDAHDNNGANTGECLKGWCQQYRYCPPENDTVTIKNKLLGVENFTIFLKVVVEFADFGVDLINIQDITGIGSLVEGYNLFKVSNILDECDLDIDDLMEDGALIKGSITYNCDFDEDEECSPYPEFSWALEDTHTDIVSSGFNFRKAYFSLNSNGTTDRLLVKYHGIRMKFTVTGEGGKFDVGAFTTTLGSGIALTAISIFVTEFLLRHCIPERSFYTGKRMQVVSIEEEEEWVRRSSNPDTVAVEMGGKTPQDPSSSSEDPSSQQGKITEDLKPSAQRESGRPVGISVTL